MRVVAVALAVALLAVLAQYVTLAPSARAASYTGPAYDAGFAVGGSLHGASDADLARALDGAAKTGRRWLRVDLHWSATNPADGRYEWGGTDRVVRAAVARGLQVVLTAAYTPAWARPAGTTDKAPPTDPRTYGTFLWNAAKRYSAMGVHHWEIWHQPNLSGFWSPRPDAAAYARLLGHGSSAVRSADPSATVITGALAPAADAGDGSALSPATFLGRLYDTGAARNFDAVGVNPSSFPADPMTPGTAFAAMPSLHDLMEDRADGAQLWGLGFTIPTGTGSRAVTEAGQATQLKRALEQMAQWTWAGPLLVETYRDRGSNLQAEHENTGLVRRDWSAKPALASFSTTSTSTSTTAAPATTSTTAAPKPATTTTTVPASSTKRLMGSRAGFAGSWQMLWGTDADLDRQLDAMAASGAKWLRIDVDWPSIQPTRDQWNWGPTDRVFTRARARGINILGVPAYTPPWNRPAGTDAKHAPTDRDAYARFVGEAVRRYAPMGVKAWEIWNEPNQKYWWKPAPNPAAYTDLLKRAYRAAKAADPGATVISAGLAPAPDAADGSQINAETFVRKMYENGAKGHFDALGMHPYNFPGSILTYHKMNAFSGTTPALHDLMVKWGDGHKKIWLTEFGAPTGGGNGAVDEGTQAQMIDDGFTASSKWSWAGPLFVYLYRDNGTDWHNREDNFGLVRRDYSPKQAWHRFVSVMKREY